MLIDNIIANNKVISVTQEKRLSELKGKLKGSKNWESWKLELST